MSGVNEIRLYHNTVDTIPQEYTNVTAPVFNSSTKNHGVGIKRYLDGVTTLDGLNAGTTYHFWAEFIDVRGNSSGVQYIGTHMTERINMDSHMIQYGNNIIQEGPYLKYNGNNSYVRLADMTASGIDYGAFVRSGTWSMTLWIKPSTAGNNSRLVSFRQEDLGFLIIDDDTLFWQSNRIVEEPSINMWDFYAISVDNHVWTIHTSKTATPGSLVTFNLGNWDLSSLDRERMIIGGNAYWGTIPDDRMWGGYTSKFTISGQPLTVDEVGTIYDREKDLHT